MKRTLSLLLTVILIFAALPLAVFAEAPSGDVFINIDGAVYRAHEGDIIDYVVYLCTGEQLCSLDGELYFSPDGLALVPEETEDISLGEQIFPKIGNSVVTNLYEPGHMAFNFSSANGKSFSSETSKLIQTQFCVTASSGSYELNTTLTVVCGSKEKKYIYKGVAITPLPRFETEVPGREPYVPDETEPAPTQEPTVPETEAPTDPPTEPANRVLTDPLTGITVVHETADALEVTPITENHGRCYLYNFENLTLYQVNLIKDGERMSPDEPVKVTIPAPEGARLFRLGNLSAAAVETAYAEDRFVFTDQALGIFAVSKDGSGVRIELYGNVDGDRAITVVDATHIQRDLASIVSFTDDQRKIGDVDGDGVTTIVDATYIQRWLAGLSSKLDRFDYPRA